MAIGNVGCHVFVERWAASEFELDQFVQPYYREHGGVLSNLGGEHFHFTS